ncbi:hydroxypyruvate reductase [Labrys miyagiensis]|uniref:Hydroxypyruvate reductase n=1 Tax=Labrys miyagiensis TaxID=346912 RepID=A0ABQ6CHC2_9HYPH|nr:glycerate kinase [Labrys miyagiensis]GLS19751.1 hydroxypyruvate reductase [Labrys miyagiensis]
MPERALLQSMFQAAVAAATPASCIPAFLPRPPKGRTFVVGAGKAAAAMAKALEDVWPGPLQGIVVTRYGHGVPCRQVKVIEAGHPVPDLNGVKAAARMMAMMDGAGKDDLVIALISGGGSALLSLPAGGLLLSDKQAINKALLRCGAPIDEINCVRKHISGIKGGQLAAMAHPARVVSLVISDVPGDDLAAIASGPTVADPTTFADARAVLARYGIDGPQPIVSHLRAALEETPKPGDPRLARSEAHLIASPQRSLLAAADIARKAGITPIILGDALEGEARDVGIVMAGMARHVAVHGQPFPSPCVLISGGETTVTLRGNGKGGRNVEFLLSLAVKLGGQPGIHALAGDTDGIDGAEEAAGAVIAPCSLRRAREAGIDPVASLDNNDAHTFFRMIGDQIVTGPTLTNVNDFRAVLVLPEGVRLS